MRLAPRETLAARHGKLREAVNAADLDSLVVTHLPNVFYLTNFQGTAGIAVVTLDRLYLILDFRYSAAANALWDTPYGCPDAEIVPVGEDQRQHIELTRDLGHRFNTRFGETFVLPEARIPSATAKIFDLQNPGSKMSKSGDSPQGILWLLDEPSVNAKKIKSAVTDADRDIRFDPEQKPGVSNLLTIYSALTGRSVADLEAEYDGQGYGALKTDLADVVVEFVTPFRDLTLGLLDDRTHLTDVLRQGAEEAGTGGRSDPAYP